MYFAAHEEGIILNTVKKTKKNKILILFFIYELFLNKEIVNKGTFLLLKYLS